MLAGDLANPGEETLGGRAAAGVGADAAGPRPEAIFVIPAHRRCQPTQKSSKTSRGAAKSPANAGVSPRRGTAPPSGRCRAPSPNQCADHDIFARWPKVVPSALILLSSGRWSAPRRSCAILRQTAIGQKPGQAEREQVPRGFGAVDTPGLCRPRMQLISLSRSRTERRSCRGCAGRKQFGRRKEPGRPVPIGRDNVRYCG